MHSRSKAILILALIILTAVLAGCAPGDEVFVARAAGFWAGLWHGFISLVTLVVSLFVDSVHVYEVNNTGWWYDFGFLLGASGALGGGGFSGGRRSRHQRR